MSKADTATLPLASMLIEEPTSNHFHKARWGEGSPCGGSWTGLEKAVSLSKRSPFRPGEPKV